MTNSVDSEKTKQRLSPDRERVLNDLGFASEQSSRRPDMFDLYDDEGFVLAEVTRDIAIADLATMVKLSDKSWARGRIAGEESMRRAFRELIGAAAFVIPER